MNYAYLYDWAGNNAALFSFLNALNWPVLNGLAWLLSHMIDFKVAWLYSLLLALGVNATNNWDGISGAEGRGRERWAMWSRFTLSLLLTTGLVAALKVGFAFPRPLDVLGASAVHVVGSPEHGHSFPSGHAALAGLFLTCFWARLGTKGRLALLVLPPLMMLSRIVVGAHFPADVVAGVLIGLAVPLAVSPQRALSLVLTVYDWVASWHAGREHQGARASR